MTYFWSRVKETTFWPTALPWHVKVLDLICYAGQTEQGYVFYLPSFSSSFGGNQSEGTEYSRQSLRGLWRIENKSLPVLSWKVDGSPGISWFRRCG